MENFLSENIFYLIGVLLSVTAIATIIFSFTALIIFRKKNKLKSNPTEDQTIKNEFEFLTPVVLKKIEHVTKVVEIKKVKTSDEKSDKADKFDDEMISDELKLNSEKALTNSTFSSDNEVEEEKDKTSERYKVESRFLKDKNDL